MKNIDKIRAMSAEELADCIKGNSCRFCSYRQDFKKCGEVICREAIAEWLEQDINPMPYLKMGDIVINRSDVELVIQNACIGKAMDLATDTSISKSILTNDYVKKIYRYNKETGDMEEIWRADNDFRKKVDNGG